MTIEITRHYFPAHALTDGHCGFVLHSDHVAARAADKAEIERLRGIVEALPADWRTDSSLETWFPYTAETFAELEKDAERWRRLQCLPKSEVIRVLQCDEPAERYKDPGVAYTLQEFVDAAIAAAKPNPQGERT